MKRAILATAGTVAGLVAVLAHTPTEVAIRSTTADSPLGLGGPAPAPATATRDRPDIRTTTRDHQSRDSISDQGVEATSVE